MIFFDFRLYSLLYPSVVAKQFLVRAMKNEASQVARRSNAIFRASFKAHMLCPLLPPLSPTSRLFSYLSASQFKQLFRVSLLQCFTTFLMLSDYVAPRSHSLPTSTSTARNLPSSITTAAHFSLDSALHFMSVIYAHQSV